MKRIAYPISSLYSIRRLPVPASETMGEVPFRNDGSFLELFKQMQAEQDRVSLEPTNIPVPNETDVDDDDSHKAYAVHFLKYFVHSQMEKVDFAEAVPPNDPRVLVAIESLVLRLRGLSKGLCDAEIKKFEDSVQYWFLTLPDTNEYKYFRRRLKETRCPKPAHVTQTALSDIPLPSSTKPSKSEDSEAAGERKRKSRWAGAEQSEVKSEETACEHSIDHSAEIEKAIATARAAAAATGLYAPAQTTVAKQFTGGVALSEEQTEQIRYQKELQAMHEFIMAQQRLKLKEQELMSRIAGPAYSKRPKVTKDGLVIKYEYDSDEDCEGGTWEHKLRQAEMMATRDWAEKLTEMGHGKHHIGDFLPPDELERFMETFRALKEGRNPDYSEYKQFKLTCENVGFQMLEKMGWKEGEGLGAEGQGIINPVDKGNVHVDGIGLGIERPSKLVKEDDEYDAYRKRMMLAYRFRPNPLVYCGMSSANQMIHVCQRCCNPLKLHEDFEKLQQDKVLALVDAQRFDRDDSRPPIIVPVKNAGIDYPKYFVPPKSLATNTDAEALDLLQRYSTPTTSLDHRQKVSSSLFDILSGRTDVDHPLCQECADVLLSAKEKCLEYQEEELNCLRSYMSYLDAKAARAEAKLKYRQDVSVDLRPSVTQLSVDQPIGVSEDCNMPQLTSAEEEPSLNYSANWLSCLSLTDQPGTVMAFPSNDSWSDDNDTDEEVGYMVKEDEAIVGKMVVPGAKLTESTGSEDQYASLTSQQLPKPTDEKCTKKRRARLCEFQETVAQLQTKLADVLAEGIKLDQQLAADTAELERRTEELDRAQTQYNEQKQTLLEAEEELFSLQARVKHAEQHLQRLLRTNVLNTAFPIWYDGHFCVINGLHLGRLSNRPVSWEEINAAWGQCAMLLQCIIRRINYTSQDYHVVPLGSQSKVIDLSNHKEYPLYYATSGMQLFGVSKFDSAMCIFLKCLNQVQLVVEELTQTKLPYWIKDGGKIHDPREGRTYSIKWSGNSEENWTKALKMMLLNMKWIIARLAAIDGRAKLNVRPENPSTVPTGQLS
ncbi:splicing factor 4 [Paragonimus westermani]|uniref:Splicing factor 4 n=1 Tax=Paragonimus westermani TaxID=34504 RepID=A0A5J4NV99_9TREM|nr:splicing factor 4 [Paragonimus westermani]